MKTRVKTIAFQHQSYWEITILAFVICSLAWMFTGIAYGQTGDDAYRLAGRAPGVNAINMGLAGTGIAGVSDGSAFFTNPAGLGWAKGSYFSGSLTGLNTTDKGVFTAPGISSPLKNDVTASGLGSLSYLFKLPTTQGSMVVGASFNQVASFERSLLFKGNNQSNSFTDFLMPVESEFTLETDADGTFPSFDRTLSFIGFETFAIDLDQDKLSAGNSVPFTPAVTRGTLSQIGFVDETGRMSEINVGGAMEIAKDVMFGASINIPFGTYTYSRELVEDDFNNHNDGFGGTTDFDFLRFQERVESDVVGANVRFGFSAVVRPNLSLGMSVESPTYYSVDDNYSTVLSTLFDNGDSFEYGGDDRDAGTGSFTYSFTTPWKLGLGAAHTFGKAHIAADIEYIDWSQMEMDSEEDNFADENVAITRGLDAVLNTRLSVVYNLDDSWVVRAGLAIYPDAHANKLEAGGAEINRDRTFVSAGVGYTIGKNIRADFSWMRESFEDKYQVYTDFVDAPAPYVTEDVMRSRFQLGVTFGF
ncbi:MAG: outer membrane protein transport protein [Bacteroidetes bacterium]|nr:outer membrane protein transport protein [Bacteroidota bacterium]